MEIKLKQSALRALVVLGGLAVGWYANEYIGSDDKKEATTTPRHSIHYAQLGVPEAESFSGINSLQSKFYRDGDHYEYPLTFLCGCTFTWSQWGLADKDNAELEGKIFRVIHTPLTFWNKRLYFLKEEVDEYGKPLPPPKSPTEGGM